MATDHSAEQSDRDDGLLRRMCYVQEALADNIKTWLQEELNALVSRTQMLEAITITDEERKKTLRQQKEAIARLYESEVADAFERLKERRAEIESGLYNDPLESQHYLNDSLGAILGIMQSIIGIRIGVDEVWKECVPDAED